MKPNPLLELYTVRARQMGFDTLKLELRLQQMEEKDGPQIQQWTKASVRELVEEVEKEVNRLCKKLDITRLEAATLGPRRYHQGPLAFLNTLVVLRDIDQGSDFRYGVRDGTSHSEQGVGDHDSAGAKASGLREADT